MIHDRNTGPTVMTKTEKVKTFFEPYPCTDPLPPSPATPEWNFAGTKKKTYLIKALREKYVVARVCACVNFLDPARVRIEFMSPVYWTAAAKHPETQTKHETILYIILL